MSEKPKIYIESGPIIDLVKFQVGITANTRNDLQNQVWYTQRLIEAARAGDVRLFTSTVTIAECTHVGDPAKLDAAKSFFMGLLASGKGGFHLIQASVAVAEQARQLRWVEALKLKGADALHVASALRLECAELLTGDKGILACAPRLQTFRLTACLPSATKLLPAEYYQTDLALPPPAN